MSQALFLFLAALGLLAALGTVLVRNLVHAALYLVAFFFIIACQFVLLEAEFLAAIQVLVYIGAVAILMMFAIMLTRNVQGDDPTTVPSGWRLPAVVVGLGLFAVLVFGINGHIGIKGRSSWSKLTTRPVFPRVEGQPESPRAAAINNMGKAVGDEMMTRFVVPFEVAGLLLTVALVGAIAVAYHERDDEAPQRVARRGSRPDATGLTQDSGNGRGGTEAARTETLSHPSS